MFRKQPCGFSGPAQPISRHLLTLGKGEWMHPAPVVCPPRPRNMCCPPPKKLLKGTAGSIHGKPLQASASYLEIGRIGLKGAIFQAEKKFFWLWKHQGLFIDKWTETLLWGPQSHQELQVLPTAGCNVSQCWPESPLTADC